MAPGAGRRFLGPGPLAVGLLPVNAVVVLADDVAAGQFRLGDQGFVAVTRSAGALDPGNVSARSRFTRLLDVVVAVAVAAGRGDHVAARASLGVSGRQILLHRRFVARTTVGRLELRFVRQLFCRHVAMAVSALEVHLAMYRTGKRLRIDPNRLAGSVLGAGVTVAHQAGIVRGRSRVSGLDRRRHTKQGGRQGDQDRPMPGTPKGLHGGAPRAGARRLESAGSVASGISTAVDPCQAAPEDRRLAVGNNESVNNLTYSAQSGVPTAGAASVAQGQSPVRQHR